MFWEGFFRFVRNFSFVTRRVCLRGCLFVLVCIVWICRWCVLLWEYDWSKMFLVVSFLFWLLRGRESYSRFARSFEVFSLWTRKILVMCLLFWLLLFILDVWNNILCIFFCFLCVFCLCFLVLIVFNVLLSSFGVVFRARIVLFC